ncbi:interferon-induced GTP-binding protein Mx-like, partial [Notothenia coriiceps]|uniref:Interferon-induced GTP-binding protein Mx-like n=1 Tax=Notothenia coriiceps TaxID=8208 RepID=A0A6I9P1K7_9TELE
SIIRDPTIYLKGFLLWASFIISRELLDLTCSSVSLYSLYVNSGIVTRCPLELKMKRRKEGEGWYGKISYQDFEEELKDLAGVEKKIREAQNKIAGPGSGISHELISLEIASPDVPDLTLIDLPGITRVAVKGQKENIENQVC